MCEPTTIGYGIAAIAGGLAVNYQIKKTQAALSSSNQQAPAAPAAPELAAAPVLKNTAPVQASKTASVQELKAANTTVNKTGQNANSTMLTGVGGVSLNPENIGRNTLLGS